MRKGKEEDEDEEKVSLLNPSKSCILEPNADNEVRRRRRRMRRKKENWKMKKKQ